MKEFPYHRIHFVGIKGVAMTALAIYCKEYGITVTGSDVDGVFPTEDSLLEAGISTLTGFSEAHIDTTKPELVIYTGAHQGKENAEVLYAEKKLIPTLSHGKALGIIMDCYQQIAVAGSHGKTTTTAMTATIFMTAEKDPSYTIGSGEIAGLGLSGHFGKGNICIVEADEYITDPAHDITPRFLWLHPDSIVVTNIDFDHPDAYSDINAVKDAFKLFIQNLRGKKTVYLNADDGESTVLKNMQNITTVTYGLSENADIRGVDIHTKEDKTYFSIHLRGIPVGEFVLSVPGKHNVVNALAAAAVSSDYGISWEQIREGLVRFGGAKRRLEHIGRFDTIDVYDDYAHHPHEIIASLDAIRFRFPDRRIITVFQPHTYSRTKSLLPGFVRSLVKSDIVLIADIYASARETNIQGINSKIFTEELAKQHRNVFYIQDLQGAIAYIKKNKRADDIIICMGAGDIYAWPAQILKSLSNI